MSSRDPKNDAWHRSLGRVAAPIPHDRATQNAVDEAFQLTVECYENQRLFKPTEALTLACRDGHRTETLYSIARRAADATGGDIDIVLHHLEQAWPEFA